MKRIICFFIIFILLLLNVCIIPSVNAENTEILASFNVSEAPFEKPDEGKFPIYQESIATPVYGVCGMGVLAYYDGSPCDIYIGRKTSLPVDKSVMTNGVAYSPSVVARVTDPDGNLAALYDFSDLEDGEQAAILTVLSTKSGIWTVQIIGGRPGDTIAIGMKESDFWGVRGECVLGNSKTIPKPSYIYSQKTAEYIFAGSTQTPVSLCDEAGNVLKTATKRSRVLTTYELTYGSLSQNASTEKVLPDSVYRIDYQSGFSGNIEIDGISGLLCPNAESARFLKGGWYDTKNDEVLLSNQTKVADSVGVVVQGPLQARARKELIRLASEKNLDLSNRKNQEGHFIFDRPDVDTALSKIENPQAESQLFGSYGVLGAIGGIVKRQITDVSSKHLGRVQSKDEALSGSLLGESAKAGFEMLNYESTQSYRGAASSLATAATIPLELNFLRENEALITRTAMCLLYTIVTMSEEGFIRQSNLRDSSSPVIAGMFDVSAYCSAFWKIHTYLERQTKEILYQGMLILADKMGDYRGQGLTNQALFSINTNLKMFKNTGDTRFHKFFKRQIEAINERVWNDIGFVNETGYFNELGLDGSYEYMNREVYYEIYNGYKDIAEADDEILKKMRENIEKSIEFECFFCAPQPGGDIFAPNHFSSRTTNDFGRGNQPSYEQIFHEFPLAARRRQMKIMPKSGVGQAASYPHVVNSDEWAIRLIKEYYDDGIYDENAVGSSWADITYSAFKAGECSTNGELMPFEAKDGTVWERDGFIALKHKGIYLYSMYGAEGSGAYAYLGGGPTGIWTQKTGYTVLSQKHLTAEQAPQSPDDIISSCVFGYDNENNFIYSGKEGTDSGEKNSFTWLKKGSKFEIEGTVPKTERRVTWTYSLNNSGVSIKAKIYPFNSGESFWLNLPLCTEDEAFEKVKEENGLLKLTYKGANISYSWDEKLKYSIKSFGKQTNLRYDTDCLRISLDENGEAEVLISTVQNEFENISFDTYKQIDKSFVKAEPEADGNLWRFDVKNIANLYGEHPINIICAFYSHDNRLMELISCKNIMTSGEEHTYSFGMKLKKELSNGKIKIFALNSLENLKPYIYFIEKNIKSQ